MKYIVEVDGARFDVALQGDTVRVDRGPPQNARVEELTGTPVRLVRVGDAVHRVTVRREKGRGRYVLRLGGRRFVVEALDERSRAIRDLTRARVGSSGPLPIVAPMPGLVVRVHVSPGDRVEAGQGVIAMEAMKMENELRAPAAGTVRAVHARVGEAVEKGTLLVELD